MQTPGSKRVPHQPKNSLPTASGEASSLEPLVKWAGGKERELKYIIPQLPADFKNYYEPFVGGGAVYTAMKASHYYVNDKSEELIAFYRAITSEHRETFFRVLDEFVAGWNTLAQLAEASAGAVLHMFQLFSGGSMNDAQLNTWINEYLSVHAADFQQVITGVIPANINRFKQELVKNIFRKLKRLKALSTETVISGSDICENFEGAMKSAYYMYLRDIYNNASKFSGSPQWLPAVFLVIRNYAYSGMFRYNAQGGFNVPYGGIEYNRKNFAKKLSYLQSTELRQRLTGSTICNLDFEEFFRCHPPGQDDFIFLDPPYDSDFSTYAGNTFTHGDHQRLAAYLTGSCQAMWMMVIKHTPFIMGLYQHKGLHIRSFEKKYLVSFMNRNNKQAEHLMITNFSR